MIKLQLDFPEFKTKEFRKINFKDKIFFIGSCFTKNMGEKFYEKKFQISANPTGILFDPHSIYKHLELITTQSCKIEEEFFVYKSLWRHWNFHTSFSNINKEMLEALINETIKSSHDFLKQTQCVFITFGSAFAYFLKEKKIFVSNCHQYPQQCFEKKLIESKEIFEMFSVLFKKIFTLNSNIKVVLNISPVRHKRDGLAENNLSKAQLFSAVHRLVQANSSQVFYLPSYEIIVDVLRDYRFYDTDLVHPNYLATEIVFDYLVKNLIDTESQNMLNELEPIINCLHHKTLHPNTNEHKMFLENLNVRIKKFETQYPSIKL